MPQMFPMPIILLGILTMSLFILGMVRIYWYAFKLPHPSSVSGLKMSTYFNQTW